MNRTSFTWSVKLQRADGRTLTRTITNYWDPSQAETATAIGVTAAAMEARTSGVHCYPLGTELVSA